jgi:3-(3-hydroxy-phenyl)propionate hydroxylase
MHEVAIIGYGPVGATLAALLGRLGVDVVVIDKNFEISSVRLNRVDL